MFIIIIIIMHFTLFFSFYEKKYKVFLQLFNHQREYQALMNQRWPYFMVVVLEVELELTVYVMS